MALRLKIMLVDDQVYVLESLKAVLREGNHTVEGFNDPVKALAAFKEKRDYDLVITDIRMPVLTGDKLIHEIHAIDPGQLCIALTAYAERDVLTDIVKEGHVVRVLLKPWKNADVLKTVEQAGAEIEKRRSAAAATQPPPAAPSDKPAPAP